MATNCGYVITRKFLMTLVMAIIWMGLPAGIYFLLQGIPIWGAILTLLALAVLLLSLDGRILNRLENRHIPRGHAFLMILSFLNSVLVIIIYLYISTSIYLSNFALIGLYIIISVFLLMLSVWFLLTSRYAS